MDLLDIKTLIEADISRHKRMPDYYGSFESEKNEYVILEALKEHGFDYEQDAQTAEYCLKATQIEIWEYYLQNVLPPLMNANIDLFEHHNMLPDNVQDILKHFGEITTYQQCEALQKALEPLGYTFEYYLDAAPFNLKKLNN